MKAAAEVFGSGSAPSQSDCLYHCHHHYCLYHYHLYDNRHHHHPDNFIPSLGLDSEGGLALHVKAPRASARPDNMLMMMMMIIIIIMIMMMMMMMMVLIKLVMMMISSNGKAD